MVTVSKFGGSCLDTPDDFRRAAELVATEPGPRVIVLSAVQGVTSSIESLLDQGVLTEPRIARLLEDLRHRHVALADALVTEESVHRVVREQLDEKLHRLERLLFGIQCTGELTKRSRDLALSFGERLAVPVFVGLLQSREIPAVGMDADKIGILTDGQFGNATAEIPEIVKRLNASIWTALRAGWTVVVQGFYGSDVKGNVTTFGRGGSDYSAAVVAAALPADRLEVWKHVDGFLTADPQLVPEARKIPVLTYREAAELAYFGAKILHPRTVEPLLGRAIPLTIRNVRDPGSGTLVVDGHREDGGEVRSIAANAHVGAVDVSGSGIGYKPGVLGQLADAVGRAGVNITSVITAQTSITVLVDRKDLPAAAQVARDLGGVVERVQVREDLSIIAIVGEGILAIRGLGARALGALAGGGVNVEMISAGACESAVYFVVREADLRPGVRALHREFFGAPAPEASEESAAVPAASPG